MDTEQNELPIILRLPQGGAVRCVAAENHRRQGPDRAQRAAGRARDLRGKRQEKSIYHKNQERVVYVTAEMAGRGPAYAVLDLQKHFKENPLPEGIRLDWRGEGEWKITLDVFRDLGLAFSAALVGIYVLLVYETASYLIPIVIMLSIPLDHDRHHAGVCPAERDCQQPGGRFPDPVFFTATAMIGMIALSRHRGAQRHHPDRLYPDPGEKRQALRRPSWSPGRSGSGPSS